VRVCRVLPDVPAIDRAFDYLIPPELEALVRVGTVVRIPLRGRPVRGWVLEDDVEPDAEASALQRLRKVSSDGPPPDLVSLAAWAAWRWAGPRTAFLRAASPPNAVPPQGGDTPGGSVGPHPEPRPGARPARDADVEAIAEAALAARWATVRWPPAARMAELLRRLVSPSGSTIIVVPDGGRADALATHLAGGGVNAVRFHGDDPAAARTAAWTRARRGECVVVGGRIALWAPVPDLAAVVLVDDADEALKEERAPAWHARELACERARRSGGRLTFVSPVPTLEALAATGPALAPSRQVERRGWGRTVVIDRREDPPGSGLFSATLIDHLRQAEGRVVCVLNRKGRARLLVCGACGQTVRCASCGAASIEGESGLDCVVCGASRPRLCSECGSTKLARLRPGIRRLRDELDALLPRDEVAEVDASTTGVPDTRVLIGTETVFHRSVHAEVVAFLDFDQELLAPRYRAAEQALWLLVRAARMAADGARSRVIVQTRLPGHDVLHSATAGDPAILEDSDRALRSMLHFPPFGGVAEVVGDGDAVAALIAGVEGLEGVTTGGGGTGPTGRIQVLVRAEDDATLCDALAAALPGARSRGRLRVEVDPLRI